VFVACCCRNCFPEKQRDPDGKERNTVPGNHRMKQRQRQRRTVGEERVEGTKKEA